MGRYGAVSRPACEMWMDDSLRLLDACVRDLEGTMRIACRNRMDAGPSPQVPRTHSPRELGGYSVDRPLMPCGVDVAAFAEGLEAYQRRSRGQPASS